MSVFSVILLFLVLGVISLKITATELNPQDPNFRCTPGELFRDKCNTCQCLENGKEALCTYKLCSIGTDDIVRPGHPEFRCIPGELFKIDCNDCRCYDGVNAFCTYGTCSKNRAQNLCLNGSSKKDDCNACKCINGEWACTKKFCIPEVDIFENKNCERGTILRRSCNICRCIPEIGYACDKLECPPDQPTDIIDDRNCLEESVYNLGCNTCKCIPGLGYLCDKKKCPEGVFVN